MPAYNYSNTAGKTTLAAYVSPSAATMTLVDPVGFPVTYPYTLVLDVDQPTMEVVTVTDLIAGVYQITRGEDGTAAVAHQAGAVVAHELVARDLSGPQAHMAATSGVHGVTGALVGTASTQTLTNKTIDAAANTISGLGDANIGSLSATKLAGQVTNAQVASLATTKLTGTVTDSQIAGMSAGKLVGQVADSQISGLSASKLTGSLNGTDVQVGGVTLPRGSSFVRVRSTNLATGVTNVEVAAYTKSLTLTANRLYRVSAVVNLQTADTSHWADVYLKDGATVLTKCLREFPFAGYPWPAFLTAYVTPSSTAAHSFTVSAINRNNNTTPFDVVASADRPFTFEVTDLGPSSVVDSS